MWMMGYNDGGELNMPDSCNSRRLRPLMPRPIPSTNNTNSTSNPSCLTRLPGTDFFALNHHLATMADQGNREFNAQQLVVSSRWNPTPEQLRTLEELYRRGTRTPTADQIQQITAQLRRYGKIEGKNVFYWFQNHKARERQKRRRQMESASDEPNGETLERKESGASRTGYECEQQTKNNWLPSTNCSTLSEEPGSIQRAATKGGECRTDGWMQLEEGELHRRRVFMERNATWQMMQFPSPSPHHHHHINNTAISTTAAAITTSHPITPSSMAATTITSATTMATLRGAMDPKLIKTHHHHHHLMNGIFVTPYGENGHINGGIIGHFNSNGVDEEEDGCCGGDGESQTLQLFPLSGSGHGGGGGDGNESINYEKETEISVTAAAMNASNFTAPFQFFEFLPLKN